MLIKCLKCDGSGELLHPKFGLPSCPCPEVTCDDCLGEGKIEVDKTTLVLELIALGFTEKEIEKELAKLTK